MFLYGGRSRGILLGHDLCLYSGVSLEAMEPLLAILLKSLANLPCQRSSRLRGTIFEERLCVDVDCFFLLSFSFWSSDRRFLPFPFWSR